MSYDALEVTTAHLRELAAKHGQAAAEITAAGAAVAGVDTRVRTTHGVVAWSTAAALEAIQQARADAAASIAGHSLALEENLTLAAHRYETTDQASAERLRR
jgi:ESX secretion-associated protein EspC/F